MSLILIKFEWNLVRGDGRYIVFSKFQEMTPRNANELSEWKGNRQKSYQGSLRHFLWAVNAGKAEDEHFYVYAINLKKKGDNQFTGGKYPTVQEPDYSYALTGGHRVSPGELLAASEDGSPFTMIRFHDDLRLEYWGNSPHEVSFLTLKGSYVLVDSLGNPLNPLSLEVSGFWSQERIAELLPRF